MPASWFAGLTRFARRAGALALVLVPGLVGCSREAKLAPYANASEKTAEQWAELDVGFEKMVAGYDEETGAPQITVDELRAKLADGETVILLDTRGENEYRVAHLPDAQLAPPATLDHAIFEVPDDALVVTYCTAGLRSGKAAVKLAEQHGWTTRNLHGGIVAWFNAGGEVVGPDGQPVNRIHPYGETWGRHVHPRE